MVAKHKSKRAKNPVIPGTDYSGRHTESIQFDEVTDDPMKQVDALKRSKTGPMRFKWNIEKSEYYKPILFKSELTDDRKDLVCRVLAEGLSTESAEILVGIRKRVIARLRQSVVKHMNDLDDWEDNGEIESERPVKPRGFDADHEFYQKMEQARAHGELSLIGAITQVAINGDDWKAAAWILKTTRPKKWGSYAERAALGEFELSSNQETVGNPVQALASLLAGITPPTTDFADPK